MWNATIVLNVSDKDRKFIEQVIKQCESVVDNIHVEEPDENNRRRFDRDARQVSLSISFSNDSGYPRIAYKPDRDC